MDLEYVIGLLALLAAVIAWQSVMLQRQIRNMNRQLVKRQQENSRQPVSLALMNSDLNELAININKSIKAEEDLRLKGVQEEKAFKEMIANISHDLRTPLTAIRGYQQMLERSELSVEQRTQLGVAQKHAAELGQLIEHFFEYAYAANAQPRMEAERLNLTSLVSECLLAYVSVLEQKSIAVSFDDEIPVFIKADREMVVRIVNNLVRNCVQYSTGDITVKIHEENQVVLSFQNSVGDAAEMDMNRIFDRFYSSDKARSHSAGLGLSIVKLLAESLGGSVKAVLNGNVINILVRFPKIGT